MSIELARQQAADAWHAYDYEVDIKKREYRLGFYQAKLDTLLSVFGGDEFTSEELTGPARYEYLHVATDRPCPVCKSKPSGLWIRHDFDCPAEFPSV